MESPLYITDLSTFKHHCGDDSQSAINSTGELETFIQAGSRSLTYRIIHKNPKIDSQDTISLSELVCAEARRQSQSATSVHTVSHCVQVKTQPSFFYLTEKSLSEKTFGR